MSNYTPVPGSIAQRALAMLRADAETSSRDIATPLGVPPAQIGSSLRHAVAARVVAVRVDRASRRDRATAWWRLA